MKVIKVDNKDFIWNFARGTFSGIMRKPCCRRFLRNSEERTGRHCLLMLLSKTLVTEGRKDKIIASKDGYIKWIKDGGDIGVFMGSRERTNM